MGSSNRSHLNLGVKEGQCAAVRIKDSCPWSYTRAASSSGLPLLSARSPRTDRAPTCAAKQKQDCGEDSRALRPDPGGGAECRPRRPWPYLPEPLNDRVVWAVAVLVDSMLSPVIHVHIAEATHQQLGKRESRIINGAQCECQRNHTQRGGLPQGQHADLSSQKQMQGMCSTFYLPLQTRDSFGNKGPKSNACTDHTS